MKQVSLLIFFLSLTLSAAIGQETWLVDNPHSNVRFEVGWEDFSMRTGEFKVFSGSIVSNSRDDISDAIIDFTVDATSVDVIAERLAGHIKSDRFLDVENYPEITFISNKAMKNPDGSFTSKGKLTIHGVEKDYDAHVKVKGSKKTKKGELLGLEVVLDVNKMDFGLDWGSPRLADNIKIVGHILYKLKTEEEKND